jgi:chemotaxis protein MotA
MHIALGLLGLAAVLAATIATETTHQFTGLVNRPALLLVGLAPPCIAIVSYGFEDLLGCARDLWAAARSTPRRSRLLLFDDLQRFATELRRGRPAEALAIADTASHALLRQLGPLVVKGYSPEALERTASTATHCLASQQRRSEEVATSLARAAPAVGLIGTTLGLIALLKDLSQFGQLGPSMALALLCTLYGLVLANAVYQPLARLLHARAAVAVEEARLLLRALLLVGEGKPLADLRALFESTGPTPPQPTGRPGVEVASP